MTLTKVDHDEGRSEREPKWIETVIIGAGQAGLAAGHHLRRQGRDFVVIDAIDRLGDNWRCHWDSMRLFSPARAADLPGMRFPAPRMAYPTKDDMADFLETYAARFALPIQLGTRVRRVTRDGDGFRVEADTATWRCDNVIVATGTFGRTPHVPEFAADLDPDINQLHSSQYKSPAQLRPGPVLVVGASHSGGDIAYESARAGHPTVLSGHIHGEIPFDINGRAAHVVFPIMFFLASHLLTLRTPIGRRMQSEVRAHGGPLIRVKRADLTGAGVELVDERTVAAANGRPVLAGGRTLEVANIVWCTGFRQEFSWIDIPVTTDDGWPQEARGVVESVPGLYFVGLAFQYGFTSMLVGGAGRDAEYVVSHLTRHRRSQSRKNDSTVSANDLGSVR